MKHTVITLALLAVSSLAHAGEGISADEYQRLRATAQCAFIANTLPLSQQTERSQNAFRVSIKVFKEDTAAMYPTAYNPTQDELISDYAIHYQSAASETESDMMDAMKFQGLQLSPEAWQKIAVQFWQSRNCSIVIGD